MKNIVPIFSLMILMLVGFSGCLFYNGHSGPEVREYVDTYYDVTDDSILIVTTVNGGIDIRSWDETNLYLNATKRSTRGVDDMDNVEINVIENENQLIIEVDHRQPIEERAVDLVIKIPYNVTVQTVSSTNGGIQLRDIQGDITVTSINGGIFVEDVDGYITAETTNAGITIEGVTGVDDLTSVNGGIDAEIHSTRDDIDIHTTNGGIDIKIPSSLNATIEIDTTNGSITYDTSLITTIQSTNKHVEGTIGSGGYTINVHTTNGGITVIELIN